LQKKFEKIWRIKKSAYLCSPFEKQTTNKFIEKTETVQEASTEKNTIYREALILLKN